MPLKKDQQGETNETSAPAPEAAKVEPETVPAQTTAPSPEPKPEPAKPAEPAKTDPDDPRHKFYVTKTGYLRDGTTGITYVKDRPMPGSQSGWLRCQIAAGVIMEYKQGEMGD